jgi:hypothetical protein
MTELCDECKVELDGVFICTEGGEYLCPECHIEIEEDSNWHDDFEDNCE